MKKQYWVLCRNANEENQLLSIFKNFKVDIRCDKNRANFPLIVDTKDKVIFRCTSISSCALYTSTIGKIKCFSEMKQTLLDDISKN